MSVQCEHKTRLKFQWPWPNSQSILHSNRYLKRSNASVHSPSFEWSTVLQHFFSYPKGPSHQPHPLQSLSPLPQSWKTTWHCPIEEMSQETLPLQKKNQFDLCLEAYTISFIETYHKQLPHISKQRWKCRDIARRKYRTQSMERLEDWIVRRGFQWVLWQLSEHWCSLVVWPMLCENHGNDYSQ